MGKTKQKLPARRVVSTKSNTKTKAKNKGRGELVSHVRRLARKGANFEPTEDDTYCSNIDTLLGTVKKVPEHTVLQMVLGLGPQLRGFPLVDFALPVSHEIVKQMAEDVKAGGWKSLPPFNYTQYPIMKSCVNAVKTAWNQREKAKESTKNLNTHYVKDQHLIFRQPWSRVQDKLSQVLQFYLFCWVLNPDKTRKEAYDFATFTLKNRVTTGAARRRFFTMYLRQKRECAAVNELEALQEELEDVTPSCSHFKDPLAACAIIRQNLSLLGRSDKGTPRQVFERLEDWYGELPYDSKFISRLEWIDSVKLPEFPEEKTAREAKEAKEAKEAAKKAKQSASTGGPTGGSTGGPTGGSTGGAPTGGNTPGATGDDPPANPTGKAPEQPPQQPEVPTGGHEIIDLTVDDLRPVEEQINNTQGIMVAYLVKDDVSTKGPKVTRKSTGSNLVFGKPSETEWATNKNWEFAQLQGLVATLSNSYGMPVVTMKLDKRVLYTIKCAEALGFFQKGVCTTKAHIDAHLKMWINPLHSTATFLMYMSNIYGWFGRDIIVGKSKQLDLLKANYKKAKSALDNNRFTPYASGVLRRHVQTLVTVGEEKEDVDLSKVNPPGAPPPPAETMQAAVDALVALGGK